MKSRLIIILLVLGYGCTKESNEKIAEVPESIIRTKLDSTLYPEIKVLFPESTNDSILYPILFDNSFKQKLTLNEESEVYVTFIAENAGYKNTFGWYTYDSNKPPLGSDEINIHVLFPNVSKLGEGGQLVQGDMLQLGNSKFRKGTVIGFFIILNGWQNERINYNYPFFYTDYNLNPEGQKQHVLFKEKKTKCIVLGFEDLRYIKSDKDFNDILLFISDNKEGYESMYFDLTHIPTL